MRVRTSLLLSLALPDPSSQSGLAEKIEKPSRKLRKERKNRAKKVRTTTLLSGMLFSPFLSCAARRRARPRSRPRRASNGCAIVPSCTGVLCCTLPLGILLVSAPLCICCRSQPLLQHSRPHVPYVLPYMILCICSAKGFAQSSVDRGRERVGMFVMIYRSISSATSIGLSTVLRMHMAIGAKPCTRYRSALAVVNRRAAGSLPDPSSPTSARL